MGPRQKRALFGWIAGSVVVIAGISVLAFFLVRAPNAPQETTRDIALSCTTDAATRFHIHPVLEIVINGAPQTIPADVGNIPGCLHPLHTHDASGTIHIESPVQRDFTLGDFFAVWGQPFNKDQILGYQADAAHVVTETVNGAPVQTFENTVLRDGDRIIITYATKQ